jgi:hypothetical protein
VLLLLFSLQDVWAAPKNCHVKITNPEFDNKVLANQCIEFPESMSDSTYDMAKGLCAPEWGGMNVMVNPVIHCRMASAGVCRYSLLDPQLSFSYKVFYYSVPLVTSDDNKATCLSGGGQWLED